MESEGLCEHVQEVGPYFLAQAKKLEALSIVGDVRGSHLMVGLELVQDKATKASFPYDLAVTHRIFKKCLKLGVVVRPVGNVIVLSPPLIITKAQTDTLFKVLKEGIEAIAIELN